MRSLVVAAVLAPLVWGAAAHAQAPAPAPTPAPVDDGAGSASGAASGSDDGAEPIGGGPAPAPAPDAAGDDGAAPIAPAPGPDVPTDPAAAAAALAAEASIFPVDPADRGADFGPVLVIEAIELHGNRWTADRVIRGALPIAVGDVVRAGDPRLVYARFEVLALGFFRDVHVDLRRGSARGRVVLDVTVEERGTVVLNRLWFGTSATSPWWLGADLDQRNFLGTGIGVGGGFIYASHAQVDGARDQWAAELRAADDSLRGSDWGVRGALTIQEGSEPYRVAGPTWGTGRDDFHAFSYRRLGARAAATYDATSLSRITLGARAELVDAELPGAPTRLLSDGTLVPVALDLDPGRSRIVTVSIGWDRDSRPDPALPREGTHAAAAAELGSTLLGGSYDYAVLLARWDHWWPIGKNQAIALRSAGGVVIGDAPRFDRLHVGDVDRMVTPTALGLVVAPDTARNLLGTGTGGVEYGTVGGSAVVEWSMQLWRGGAHVYGGDLFVGTGLWALDDTRDLHVRDVGWWRALPVDLIVDAGLRVDTDIGIFELSLANALGRVPR